VDGHVGEEMFLWGVSDVLAKGLGEELIGGGKVLLAMAEQHARSVIERRSCRLGHQGGFAQTGLAGDDQNFTSFAIGHALYRFADGRHLGFPTHHAHRRTQRQSSR
jgi:hypothetical protein